MSRFVSSGQEDPMNILCRMVVDTGYEDLPGNLVKHAKHAILDTIAVTIGGSAMEGIPVVVDLVKAKGGKAESIIPFYGGKVPASEAGLAIGPMSRAMDFGNIHEEGAHCSEYTVPALLAATGLKKKVTGREFITAFVLGQEVLVRIGMEWMVSRAALIGRGDGHAIFGVVAAVGKLLGLDLEALENAEGIARAMTQPHDVAMYNPAKLIARVHHGFVCQDGINACLLARRGITGPRHEVLSGPRGYFAMAKWETDPGATTRDLGEKWQILDTMFKPYVCCGGFHTAIDALLGQMQEHNFAAGDIASIHVDESFPGWTMCLPKELKWHPQTVPECQFSLPYVLATAAYDGKVSLDSYTTQARARQDVRGLMNRISASEDSSLPNLVARVHTTLKDGREFSGECYQVKGYPQNPLTELELIDKFKGCVPYSAYRLSDETVDSAINVILGLEEVDDVVNSLILPLTPG